MADQRSASRLSAAFSFVVPLALYTWTAARTVEGGDSGEFGLLGVLGGVAHPPGYPLYTLLARLCGTLPINPPFFRVALASVVCGAGAAIVIQRVAWRLTRNAWVSLITALAFALTPIEWRLSGIPEVFSLHALLVGLVMLCTLRLMEATSITRDALLLGLACGLGISNHHTTVFCFPLVLAALLPVRRKAGALKMLDALGWIVLGGGVGLTPYVLLLHWSHADPTHAWIWGHADTWRGLFDHFLRRAYGTFRIHADAREQAGLNYHWSARALGALATQYAYVFFAAGIAGAVIALRRRNLFANALLESLLFAALIFPALIKWGFNPVLEAVSERFFLMPLVLFAPLVAIGLDALSRRVKPALAIGAASTVLVGAAVVSLPSVNWRSDHIEEQYAAACVQSLPKDSVIIGTGDNLLTVMAWQRMVLGVRPDIHYIDPYTMMSDWYFDRINRELPDVHLTYDGTHAHVGELGAVISATHPAFYIPWLADQAKGAVTLAPWGLLLRVVPSGTHDNPDAQRARLEDATAALTIPLPHPTDAWSAEMLKGIVTPWAALADEYRARGRVADADAALNRLVGILPADTLEASAP